MENLTNVTTGKVRLSYVHVFKPYAYQPGQEEKFQVTILVPKTDMDTMNRINAAIEAAKQKGISDKWNGVCTCLLYTSKSWNAACNAYMVKCLIGWKIV